MVVYLIDGTVTVRPGADPEGGGGLGTPKLQKEGKMLHTRVCANVSRFSTLVQLPRPPTPSSFQILYPLLTFLREPALHFNVCMVLYHANTLLGLCGAPSDKGTCTHSEFKKAVMMQHRNGNHTLGK